MKVYAICSNRNPQLDEFIASVNQEVARINATPGCEVFDIKFTEVAPTDINDEICYFTTAYILYTECK